MESIIISSKKLLVDLFFTFSGGRYIEDVHVQPASDEHHLYWQVYAGEYKKVFTYKFSKDVLQLRARPSDAANYFVAKYQDFLSRFEAYKNDKLPVEEVPETKEKLLEHIYQAPE